MSEDLSFFDWGFKGLITTAGIVGGWFLTGMSNDIKENQKQISNHEKSLGDFKLHVSDNYSKEVNTQASLGRLHDRLDDISDDIKKLLERNHK